MSTPDFNTFPSACLISLSDECRPGPAHARTKLNHWQSNMFHLVAVICLAAAPESCAERLLPAPEPLTQAACNAGAPGRMAAWLADHPGLSGKGWQCQATDDLPALALVDLGEGALLHQGAVALADRANQGRVANLGVVIGGAAIAVIDAGTSRAQGEALYAAIRRRSDLPIRWLILTHMHPDHSFGAEVFAEAGATILASDRLAPALAERADGYLRAYAEQIGTMALMGTRVVLPDEGISRTRVLSLGPEDQLRLQPVQTAHTDNDLMVEHARSRTVFAGDLVSNQVLPVLDGSLSGWIEVLSRPPLPLRIVPGHGPAPVDWSRGVEPTLHYLVDLRDTVKAALAQGTPLSRAITERDPDDALRWKGYEETHPRNLSAAFHEMEWD